MKFFYKTRVFLNPFPGNRKEERRPLSVGSPCCSSMEEMVKEESILFSDEQGLPCLAMPKRSWNDHYTEHFPIEFCPFCGQKIEHEEKERVGVRVEQQTVAHRPSVVTREIEVPLDTQGEPS